MRRRGFLNVVLSGLVAKVVSPKIEEPLKTVDEQPRYPRKQPQEGWLASGMVYTDRDIVDGSWEDQ